MHRHSTAARLDALELADTYCSLPNGVTKWDLLDALEIANSQFNLTDAEVLYLRLAFRCVPDAMWKAGREPVHTFNRIDIARALGKSERTIHRLEASLVRKGMVVHRDAPKYRRFRAKDGEQAAGVSLAPCAVRAEEILAARDQVLEEGRRWYRARQDLYALRRRILGALAEAQLTDRALATVEEFLNEIPRRVSATTPLAEIEELVFRAREQLSEMEELVRATSLALGGDKNVLPFKQPDHTPKVLVSFSMNRECQSNSGVRAIADDPEQTRRVAENGLKVGMSKPDLADLVVQNGIEPVDQALITVLGVLGDPRRSNKIRCIKAYVGGIISKQCTSRSSKMAHYGAYFKGSQIDKKDLLW